MQGKLIYEFGPFRLEPAEHRLTRDEQPVNLSRQLFSLLELFVENSGHLLTKEELRKHLWGENHHGAEDALKVIIGNLRDTLQDDQKRPRYIETVRCKGYRFICPVTIVDNEITAVPPPTPHSEEVVSQAAAIERSPERVDSREPFSQTVTPATPIVTSPRASAKQTTLLWSFFVLIAVGALLIVAFGIRSDEPKPPTFSLYDFENGEQGWIARPNMMISRVFSSDAHAYEGKRSLAIVFDNPYSRKSQVYVINPPIRAGQTVTARILCPAENQLEAIAWFVEDREFTWSNDWQPASRLIRRGWNRFSVRVPADAPMPMARLGIEFTASAAWKGTCYLDAVEWQ